MLILAVLVILLVTCVGVSLWLLEGMVREFHAMGPAAGVAGVAEKFRWMVLGLGVAFLLVINIAVAVLLRAATMVLRPVDQLIEGSRRLAQEEFDYRVCVQGADEFGELAGGFNALAQRLQENEKRRMEMLGQIALTLNHELNNALSVIELKLRPLSRQATGNTALENSLLQIHENLDRMARTVESLKHVRRIVLTDYVSGVKMLDLERSVQDSN
jgi:signal transduction histidine kinase